MTLFLQVAVSVIFFANKTLVLVGRKSGWLVGAIAATLATVYFFRIQLYVYTVLELGLIILMGYGFWCHQHKNPRVESFIHWVVALVMLAMTCFVFSGLMTVIEFASSVGLLVGTFFLTHDKLWLGWFLYTVAHGLAAILGYHKGQPFFADFQVASAIVSFVGLMNSEWILSFDDMLGLEEELGG